MKIRIFYPQKNAKIRFFLRADLSKDGNDS
jgi:hypothetical protein